MLRGRCSEYMLRGPDGTPLRPDVVWFNFGFHSLNENAARPEYGLRNYESAYEADLDRVAGVLTNWSRDLRHEHSPPTLLFGLTTPMLFSAHADEVIRRHNVRLARAAQAWPGRPLHLPSACLTRVRDAASSQDQARAIMRKYGVATVDMHAPVIEQVATHAARHTSRARLAPHATPTRPTHALHTRVCNAQRTRPIAHARAHCHCVTPLGSAASRWSGRAALATRSAGGRTARPPDMRGSHGR